MLNKTGTLYTGTSNIVLPVTKQYFPQAFRSGSRLSYYASLFNSLEVNSSFYKVPRPATFARWSGEVPPGFQFTLKLWKQITHAKGLNFNKKDISFFMNAAGRLADTNKGCLLIQFPKSLTVQYSSKVLSLLQQVRAATKGQYWKLCAEFRHPGWYTEKVYAMLNKYKVSLVLHDMPLSAITTPVTRAPVVYMRFHGVLGDYRGTYDDAALQHYAKQIREWLLQGKDVYAYFNNTIGEAYNNALSLHQLVYDSG